MKNQVKEAKIHAVPAVYHYKNDIALTYQGSISE
jgi:hypothetical protein